MSSKKKAGRKKSGGDGITILNLLERSDSQESLSSKKKNQKEKKEPSPPENTPSSPITDEKILEHEKKIVSNSSSPVLENLIRRSHDLFMPDLNAQRLSVDLSADDLKKLGMDDRESRERFLLLRKKYISKEPIHWETQVSPPDASFFHHLSESECQLTQEQKKELLSQLVVVELNGGLDLEMGCGNRANQTIQKNGESLTFLELKVQQLEETNNEFGVNIPLVLMTSYLTDEETKEALRKFSNRNVEIHTILQSKFPLIYKDSLNPVHWEGGNCDPWYPPGSGEIFVTMKKTGKLQELLQKGKKYMFIRNIENLGAPIEPMYLSFMEKHKTNYMLEVTQRTNSDRRAGGIPVAMDNEVHILELQQVSQQQQDLFDISKYKYTNTNNIWVCLQTLNEIKDMEMDFVVKQKSVDGRNVIQLENLVSMGIHCFPKSSAVLVPRSRHRPIKTTAHLLQVLSDIYDVEKGALVINSKREPATEPLIKLGEEFKNIHQMEKRFKGIPNMLELDHLTVSGDVTFGRNVTLKGTVIVVAETGSSIDIPDGVVLENKILSGFLHLRDYQSTKKTESTVR